MQALRILQVAAEATPYAKAGGLADVIGGLSAELAAQGHDVRVVVPNYVELLPDNLRLHPVGDEHVVEIAGSSITFSFVRAEASPGEPLPYFVHCPDFFGTGGIYSSGEEEAQRFLLLCRAALQLCHDVEWAPQILHCHDWHTGLSPTLIRFDTRYSRLFATTSSVLTIHNIGYQGIFQRRVVAEAGLGQVAESLHGDVKPDDVNFLRTAIRHADAMTTVSPTHAQEIRTEQYGMGLQDDLNRRAHRLTGILNGADYRLWDPVHDQMIPARFGPGRLTGKATCRHELLRELQLDAPANVPVLGMVSRLVDHKGIDLAALVLPEFLEDNRLACVILGDGDSELVAALREIQTRFPQRCGFVAGYDEALAHRIIAGSDLLAVPSRYEPCGLTQMYALRYGTVPVVRATGGLADTITHFDPDTGQGNGAVFLDADPGGLRWALNTSAGWFQDRGDWVRLQANGMAADFSWRRQAPLYLRLYQRLLDGVRH
ncbi:MAG: glycogen synthase [Gammaproteobacteria bacterium]|nr:glycogen synthase [Gammaproteobacteria bacterium]